MDETNTDNVATRQYIHDVFVDGFMNFGLKVGFCSFSPFVTVICGPHAGNLSFLHSLSFLLRWSDDKVRVSARDELFLFGKGQDGTYKAIVSVLFKSPTTNTNTMVTREISTRDDLNQIETAYKMNSQASTEDEVQQFLQSVGFNVRPPQLGFTRDMLENAEKWDCFLLASSHHLEEVVTKWRKVHQDILSNDLLISELSLEAISLKDEKTKFEEWKVSNEDLERLHQITIRFELQEERERLNQKLRFERGEFANLEVRLKNYSVDHKRHTSICDKLKKDMKTQEVHVESIRKNSKGKKQELEKITRELVYEADLQSRLKMYQDLKHVADRVAKAGETLNAQSKPGPMFTEELKIIEETKQLSQSVEAIALDLTLSRDRYKELLSAQRDCERELKTITDEISKQKDLARESKSQLTQREEAAAKVAPEALERDRRAGKRKLETEEAEIRKNQESLTKRLKTIHGEAVVSENDYRNAKAEYNKLLATQNEREKSVKMNVDQRFLEINVESTLLVNTVTPNLNFKSTELEQQVRIMCDAINVYLGKHLSSVLPDISATLQPTNHSQIVSLNLARNDQVLELSDLSEEEGQLVLLCLFLGLIREDGSKLCMLDLSHSVFESNPSMKLKLQELIMQYSQHSQFVLTATNQQTWDDWKVFLTQPKETIILNEGA